MTSAPPVIVPSRRPFRREVLAHIERARHPVALDGAREPEAQGVSMALGIRTDDLYGVALDRPGEIARDEIALMRAFQAIAGLFQVQRMRRRACDVVDPHIPLTAHVRRGGGGVPGRGLSRRLRQRRMDLLRNDLLFA